MSKPSVDELLKLSPEEVKKILKKEGDSTCAEPKHKEWWDIFELMRMCNRAELSELETWCVLRSRFNVERMTLADTRDAQIESIIKPDLF